MSRSFVRIRSEGGIGRVVLDRPPVNVLHIPMLRELAEALEEVARAPDIRVVILTGAGRAFSAGVDVADHEPERVREMLDAFHAAMQVLLDLPVPALAAVNGAALGGGCELLLGCDVVFARRGAKLGFPEIRLGVFPPAAAVLLPRRIGMGPARDLILSGRTVRAEEAHTLGLVDRLADAEALDGEVETFAAEMAGLSGAVLRLTKQALADASERPVQEALERVETLYLEDLMALSDASEGLAAFAEKRPPVWRGS